MMGRRLGKYWPFGLLVVALRVTSCGGSAAAGEGSSVAKQQAKAAEPADANQLFRAFVNVPTRDNYLRVRRAITTSPNYDPYSSELGEIATILAEKRFEDADTRMKKAMPGHILSPNAHLLAARIALRRGEKDRARSEMGLREKCLDGIASTGNGTAQRPYLVTEVSDEYQLLRRMLKVSRQQGLLHRDSRYFDHIQCTDGSEVWFDVTDVFESLSRGRRKAADKPARDEKLPETATPPPAKR
jgi:hypothetical protein